MSDIKWWLDILHDWVEDYLRGWFCPIATLDMMEKHLSLIDLDSRLAKILILEVE